MNIVKRNLKYLMAIIFSLTAAMVFAVPGYLGVNYEPIDEEYAKDNNLPVNYGVYITSVVEGKGAEKAGIKSGDIIVEIDNQKIEDGTIFQKIIADKGAKEKVNLKVIRDGKTFNLEAVLSESPKSYSIAFVDSKDSIKALPERVIAISSDYRPFKSGDKWSVMISGMSILKLNSDLADYFGVKDGLLVLNVGKDSASEKAGFKAGDVLSAIDGKSVLNSSDLEQVFKTDDDNKEHKFTVVRKNKEITLNLKAGTAEIASMEWFSYPLYYKIIAERDARSKVRALEITANEHTRELERQMREITARAKRLGKEMGGEEREKALKELQEKQKQVEEELKARMIDMRIDSTDELSKKVQEKVMKQMEQKLKELEAKLKELEKKFQEQEKVSEEKDK